MSEPEVDGGMKASAWGCMALLVVAAAIGVALLLARPVHAEDVRQEYVRVTFYDLPGRMADGAMVHEGAAACSAWMPMGTVKAKGCTARVAELYDRCACGRGKYRWLPRCHWCHGKLRAA